MNDCGCHSEVKDTIQAKVLIVLLIINATLFILELGIGWYAQSTGLMADAIDMLADAMVYGIGLYAVGRTAGSKARAALVSGWFQGALGLLILLDVMRRAFVVSEPAAALMMGVGVLTLFANIYCLHLIHPHRHGEVHMRSSWIFSRNDVIANGGVIVAGGLVWLLHSRWPDLIIGSLIALVILHGAWQIIHAARQELARHDANGNLPDTTTRIHHDA